MGECIESKIIIDTGTLEKILNDPQAVLENEEAFWEEEKPQIYTKLWAQGVGYEIPFEKWREQVKEWAGLSPDERGNQDFMKMSQALIEGREDFVRKAIPHLCSYLPEEADLNVTIRLTAFIPPNAFAWQDIILNVTSPYWKGKVENIWNLLVHELFHAGYSYYREANEEEEHADVTAYKMLQNMHSEGACNYVAYQALPLFPVSNNEDYEMLESQEDVERLLGVVNEAFSMVGEVDEDTLQKFVWEECVLGRAYYVVGSYMCRVLDEKGGRELLMDTLAEGPLSFLKHYNALVDEKLRVRVEL
jgi:hypothetical protein